MQKLKINGIYKHFKGDYYLVEGIAKDSATQDHNKYPDVKQKYRFELQDIKSVKNS